MRVQRREDLEARYVERFRACDGRAQDRRWHVSDLVFCPAKVYYRRRGEMPAAQDSAVLLWAAGKAHHDLLEGRIREVEEERDGVVGTIDTLTLEGRGVRVIEWKTTRAAPRPELPEHYVAQLAAYCYLAGTTRGQLAVLHLLGTWNPPTEPLLRVYDLEFAWTELEGAWRGLLARRADIQRALAEGRPPRGPQYDWECRMCPAREGCPFSRGKEGA